MGRYVESYKQRLIRERRLVEIMQQDQELGLYEGGAYGHLMHPFDDINLTFNDLQEMIDISIKGAFSPENFVQEKTDGQNLMFTWKDEALRAARNKGHLKNRGETSLTKRELKEKFDGRGEIQVAFTQAMNDLENAIVMISQKQREDIFEDGKKFMSVEVIYPETQNVIPYGMSMLVFHGINEYDEEGNLISQDKSWAKKLADIIKEVNENVQDTFHIRGPLDLDLKPLPNLNKKKAYYSKELKSIMKEFNLSGNNKLEDYVHAWWHQYINKNFSEYSEKVKDLLFTRWAKNDKKTANIKAFKGEISKEELAKIQDFEKRTLKYADKESKSKLEFLFLELGTDILHNVSDFLSVIPDQATKQIISDIEKTIDEIKSSDDPQNIEKLEREILRLEMSGGLQKAVPSEGITFVYKGKLYKYTGLFAGINQIVGILKYNR